MKILFLGDVVGVSGCSKIIENHKDIKKTDKTKNTSLPKKKTEKPSKNESRPNSISKPTISSGLKLKINLKDKKVKKEHYCHICKLNFPSSHPIKYYNHYRLKHRDIVEVSVYCFSIYRVSKCKNHVLRESER